VPRKELEEEFMDQMEDPKMEDAGSSRLKEEQAMHVYHSSHQYMSEGNGWKSKYMLSHSEIPIGSLPDKATSSQAEK